MWLIVWQHYYKAVLVCVWPLLTGRVPQLDVNPLSSPDRPIRAAGFVHLTGQKQIFLRLYTLHKSVMNTLPFSADSVRFAHAKRATTMLHCCGGCQGVAMRLLRWFLVCSSRKPEFTFHTVKHSRVTHTWWQSGKHLISAATPDCVTLKHQRLFDVLTAQVFVLKEGSLLCKAIWSCIHLSPKTHTHAHTSVTLPANAVSSKQMFSQFLLPWELLLLYSIHIQIKKLSESTDTLIKYYSSNSISTHQIDR